MPSYQPPTNTVPVHTGRLLLSARDPFRLPEETALVAALKAAGFLGIPLDDQGCAFAAGERFLQLLTFAGCSVQLALAPGDGPFCHIRLAGPFDNPIFVSGRNTRPPRCRHCRSPLRAWKQGVLNGLTAAAARIPCATCGALSPPWRYDWKEKAGFGRLFIHIEEIFPGEAIPTPALMNLLERAAGCKWQHFYIQDG